MEGVSTRFGGFILDDLMESVMRQAPCVRLRLDEGKALNSSIVTFTTFVLEYDRMHTERYGNLAESITYSKYCK